MSEFNRLSQKNRENYAIRTTVYQGQLKGAEEPIAYLKSRGITGEAAQYHRLGYVATPEPGDEKYAGRLTIPYITPTGVVAIKGRLLADTGERDAPKYLQLAGEGTHMFNVRDLHKPSPHIVICEGEIDAITCSSLAGVPCIGIPGVNTWDGLYKHSFVDYDQVLLLMDSDGPGRDAANRIRKDLPNARIVTFTQEGCDANSWFLQHGAEGLREALGVSNATA